jgi:hypothetical protein
MKVHLQGGPLDGTLLETPDGSIEPELVLFSESRRIHRYIWDKDNVYIYLSPDILMDDSRAFEAWWEKYGGDDSARQEAWDAWQEATNRF